MSVKLSCSLHTNSSWESYLANDFCIVSNAGETITHFQLGALPSAYTCMDFWFSLSVIIHFSYFCEMKMTGTFLITVNFNTKSTLSKIIDSQKLISIVKKGKQDHFYPIFEQSLKYSANYPYSFKIMIYIFLMLPSCLRCGEKVFFHTVLCNSFF